MSNGLVTIVLPIYNVEKYLNRCINSIVNQTYKNLEIILVDDGSPDKCPEMCDEWEKKDTRIKVIHKQNEGLGMARNTGIENATGDYICFFDSDDYLELTAIEKLYKLAEKTDPDIVTYGYSKVNDSGNIYEKSIPNVKKITYEKKEIMEEFLPDMIFEVETSDNHNLHMSAWASMLFFKSYFKFRMEICFRKRSNSRRCIFIDGIISKHKKSLSIRRGIILLL